ncbi:uncharacterized protein LOC128145370 [Harpia harpyja]|uniref:uncharacterized protein LOC128145370 n=1 Tax=Harpia harpyja TaxID=202280 RepID=UPI0022B2060E|nr:uncharacterized protein LOC128145370 [Harpia harpyja]
MQTSRHHHSWEDEAPRLPHAARLGAGGGGGGQERSLCCGTLPPVSPSPSFSSIFHSSCFLHKAGVSRDSSQMFSAAHHIAFLMKYSWSLSAFCHESLLQLPAMETLCRQHSCKATRPGLLTPRLPLGTFTPLLLPLPPPAGSAGAGGFVPPCLAADASPRVQPGPTCWGHRCPHAAVTHPEAGSPAPWVPPSSGDKATLDGATLSLPRMPPCHPALSWDRPEAGARACPCCGLRGVMDVDVPPVWSLLGCAKDCRAPNLLGCGDGDGTPHPMAPLQPSGLSIPRRRRRFIHPEAYPSEHQYMWSFTKHAQAPLAASGTRIGPGEENRAPSHAPDGGSMGG